ncbi:periplasmic heavy metal sensor, partial [Pseudomonas asplenii]
EVAVNQHGLRQALMQLPEPRRKQLRQLLRQNQANSQPLVLAGREARQDVIRQLEAPTLDRNALLADLARAREADNSLRVLIDNTLADF